MTVTSDLTNFTNDFTTVLDTSLTMPPPPLGRARVCTAGVVLNYVEGGRPPAISVSATNRKDVNSLGNSVNFDGISPLAVQTTLLDGAALFSAGLDNGKPYRMTQSSSSVTLGASILRVNSSFSNVDTSFAMSESSQPGDLLNTAMRMSEQSAQNLMRYNRCGIVIHYPF